MRCPTGEGQFGIPLVWLDDLVEHVDFVNVFTDDELENLILFACENGADFIIAKFLQA